MKYLSLILILFVFSCKEGEKEKEKDIIFVHDTITVFKNTPIFIHDTIFSDKISIGRHEGDIIVGDKTVNERP